MKTCDYCNGICSMYPKLITFRLHLPNDHDYEPDLFG